MNHAKEETERLRTIGGTAAAGPPLGAREIYGDLGRVSLERGEYEAAAAFRELVRVAPGDPNVQIGLVRAHVARDELASATIPLVTALVLDPNRQDALRMLVDVLRRSDPNGCALTTQPDGVVLDWRCPSLHAALCAADSELARAFVAADQVVAAEQLDRNTVVNHHCPENTPRRPEPTAR